MVKYIGSSEWENEIYFNGKFDLKTDYFKNQYVHNIKYDEKSIERYRNYILNAHLQYLKPYIVNELIYDKSKVNDLEKLKKLLGKNINKVIKIHGEDGKEFTTLEIALYLNKNV